MSGWSPLAELSLPEDSLLDASLVAVEDGWFVAASVSAAVVVEVSSVPPHADASKAIAASIAASEAVARRRGWGENVRVMVVLFQLLVRAP